MHQWRALLVVPAFMVLVLGQVAHETSAAPTPGKFVDVTSSSGINFQYQPSHTSKKYLLETMGSGVVGIISILSTH